MASKQYNRKILATIEKTQKGNTMGLQMADNYEQENTEATEGNDGADVSNDVTQTEGAEAEATEGTAEAKAAYKPFENGKERFKIDGEDVEFDWDTAKKYVSLGKTAYKRMQEAAEQKKQVTQTYQQLVELAKSDPETLIRVFNPNYAPQARGSQKQASAEGLDQVTDVDPRDSELASVKQELQDLRSRYEKAEIEQERKLIEQELTDAVGKYPVLKDNKFALTYVKQEYRKALQQGLDVTIEDVAFYAAQDIQNQQKEKVQQTQKRLEQKRKQAPVSVVSSAAEHGQKPMSLEDVKKLAGRG